MSFLLKCLEPGNLGLDPCSVLSSCVILGRLFCVHGVKGMGGMERNKTGKIGRVKTEGSNIICKSLNSYKWVGSH